MFKRTWWESRFVISLALSSFIIVQLGMSQGFAQRITTQMEPERARLAESNDDSNGPADKLSSDLQERIGAVNRNLKKDQLQRVIIQLRETNSAASINFDGAEMALVEQTVAAAATTNQMRSTAMRARIEGLQGKFTRALNRLGFITAELPLSKIRELSTDPEVAYITPDRTVAASGHVAYSTGADASWGNVVTQSVCQGKGVGVAIIDSGIDTNHVMFTYWQNGVQASRVVYSKDFTGQNTTADNFGHGTHVATLVAGGWNMGDTYNGVVPEAHLLNLRVLDNSGAGTMSNVVAALDWCIANKSTYNIRVINISLGTLPKDSYVNDPMCKAARRAFNAGILVVASAGNNGKDAQGRIVYGGINSPGTEPSALTVGAANTFGTENRGDDKVTTYSSRGPTRGYVTLSNGIKKYDDFIKPDLIAPGNKLIAARSGPSRYNASSLVRKYPSLEINNGASDSNGLMYMSGTSMAAPVVSGAAAMLFQARPDLTPNLAKAILMYTAQPLVSENTFEQGAGLLNIKGATEVVNLLKSGVTALTNGASMLTGNLTNQQGEGQFSWLYNTPSRCYWGRGIITNQGFLYGDNLMKYYQAVYSNGTLLADATPYVNGTLTRSSTLTSSGVNLYSGAISNTGTLLADGTLLASGTLLADGTLLASGTLLSDGIIYADTTTGTTATSAETAIFGDNTACMQPY